MCFGHMYKVSAWNYHKKISRECFGELMKHPTGLHTPLSLNPMYGSSRSETRIMPHTIYLLWIVRYCQSYYENNKWTLNRLVALGNWFISLIGYNTSTSRTKPSVLSNSIDLISVSCNQWIFQYGILYHCVCLFIVLTHWLLGDLDAILKLQSRFIDWYLHIVQWQWPEMNAKGPHRW